MRAAGYRLIDCTNLRIVNLCCCMPGMACAPPPCTSIASACRYLTRNWVWLPWRRQPGCIGRSKRTACPLPLKNCQNPPLPERIENPIARQQRCPLVTRLYPLRPPRQEFPWQMLNIPWWDGRRNNLHCLKPIALSMVAGGSSYWRERRVSARRAWPRNFSIAFRREVRLSSPLAVMKAKHISPMVRSSHCYALLLLKKATSTSWMSCR